MGHDTRCHVDAIERTVDPEALLAARHVHLAVGGMGCPTCALRVRNALLSVPGVVQAEVSAHTSSADVWIDANQVGVEDLIQGVADASAGTHHNYRAVPVREDLQGA